MEKKFNYNYLKINKKGFDKGFLREGFKKKQAKFAGRHIY